MFTLKERRPEICGSDRSPRSGNLGSLFVCVSVNFMLRRALKEFLHSKESREVLGQERAQERKLKRESLSKQVSRQVARQASRQVSRQASTRNAF